MKALPLLLVLALLSPSCHQKTDEDVLLELVQTLSDRAEKKDLPGLMAHFAEDFEDFEGRNKEGIENLLQSYFEGRTGIVVHVLSTRVEEIQDKQAILLTEVALSSGGAKALRRLVKVSPDIYRITVDLVQEGEDWLIHYAAWTWVDLSEIFPESLSLLKKFFPLI